MKPAPRPPRLAIFSHNYWPESTGIPEYNTMMAEWFQRRGWDVTVLTGIPHYPNWKVPEPYSSRSYVGEAGDETRRGVSIRRVRHYVPGPSPSGADRIRLDASYLVNWLRRYPHLSQRPDIVLAVAPPLLGGLTARIMATHWRVPLAWHIQDLQIDAAQGLGFLTAWAARPLHVIERISLRLADEVSACGRHMARTVTGRMPGTTCHHFPNWADLKGIHPGQGPLLSRDELGIPPNHTVIMYSGSLGAKHGIGTIFDAAKILAERHQPAHFLVAGSEPEVTSLLASGRVPKNVTMTDLQDRAVLGNFLAVGDIHLIPQRPQAADYVLPSKLTNIMAAGRPFVVTSAPGTELARICYDSDAGIAVPPGDPEALATALVDLTADPHRQECMASNARRWAERHLDPDHILLKAESRLLHLVKKRCLRRWTPTKRTP